MGHEKTPETLRKLMESLPRVSTIFDLEVYIKNPEMIRALDDQRFLVLSWGEDFFEEAVRLDRQTMLQAKENDALSKRLKTASDLSLGYLIMSVTASISSGIGVNYATGTTDTVKFGWILIGLSVVINVLAFVLKLTVGSSGD